MNKSGAVIKRLRFENYIWVIYLVIALGNIWADELIIKSIEEHENKYDKLAKIIFLISLIVTLIIYVFSPFFTVYCPTEFALKIFALLIVMPSELEETLQLPSPR